MKRLSLSEHPEEAILQASACVAGGGLVLYPTETVYGVAVDALNPDAVANLLRYKNRPAGKAISVLLPDKRSAERYVTLNPTANRLIDTFLPGPLTVVCQDNGLVDPRLPSELGTLGLRISSHPVAMALSQACGRPITATSANASGRGRAYAVDTILEGLSPQQQGLIDLVLDAGTLPSHDPSTVIDTTREVQEVLRGGSYLEKVSSSYVSHSEEETIAFAERFARSLLPITKDKALVLILEGDLGAGKTRFAKGVAKALDIERNVNSPTFTLMKEYNGSYDGSDILMIHMDCWRMDSVDASQLGLDGYLKPGVVMVAEWAHALLPYFRSYPEKASAFHIAIMTGAQEERTLSLISEE